MSSNISSDNTQEHSYAHAFGATIFAIVLVGLIALSFITQANGQRSVAETEPLTVESVSVLESDEDTQKFQPENTGLLLEGDSLNGFESDFVAYLNQDYGFSFTYLRALDIDYMITQEEGLNISLSDGSGDGEIVVQAQLLNDPASYVDNFVANSEAVIDRSTTENGFTTLEFSESIEGVTRVVQTIASERAIYNISFFTVEDNPLADSRYEQYQGVVDSLTIQ